MDRVEYDDEVQMTIGDESNPSHISGGVPHDYADTVVAKNILDSQAKQFEQPQKPETSASMKKIENKLKRLADLGDINATKQNQIYMEALTEVAKSNPEVANVLSLVQAGLTQ